MSVIGSRGVTRTMLGYRWERPAALIETSLIIILKGCFVFCIGYCPARFYFLKVLFFVHWFYLPMLLNPPFKLEKEGLYPFQVRPVTSYRLVEVPID